MKDHEYWKFGLKETGCILGGMVLSMVISLGLRAAPPWWFLPLPRRMRRSTGISTWAIYEGEGGYDHFWLQSLWGWMIVGAILGLIFSNVVLRGKRWR